MVKYRPAKPFSSGMEYEVFRCNYCEKCKFHKERPGDGFPALVEDGGCPIEDDMERCRFGSVEFPKEILSAYTEDGQLIQHYHCPFFTKSRKKQQNW